MYITFFAGSPCAKTVSFPRNLATLLPRPAESRNNCTSKAGLLEFAFLAEGVTGTGTRRAAVDTIAYNSMKLRRLFNIVQSASRSTRIHKMPLELAKFSAFQWNF